ncbi:unnamed protein product [Ambrosiozyma monospora]|uniref:Unnamed protein product n=1 Tax=Ambrosiozyma monospora TaxID=43982 RepID=A0ACB5U2Y1_AMBMO|nr:unnamed protein product [Ambrosiozyma monospora]
MRFQTSILSTLFLALTAMVPMPVQADETVTIGDNEFVSYGLKGFGYVGASAVDKYGDTISFGSSVALQKSSLSVASDGTYTFTAYGLPDRGYNVDGTNNYIPRLQVFDISFKPSDSDSSDTGNIKWSYKDTILLTDFNGNNMTGLDSNDKVTMNGYKMPAATFHGDGWGNDLDSSSTTTAISLDAEGLALIEGDIANGFWVSDEYGPGLYKFNSDGKLVDYIKAPDAILPHVDGKVTYSSGNPPSWDKDDWKVDDQDSGRDRNKGYEGMDLSSDGKTLYALLQSATDQEGGEKDYTDGTVRLMKYDVSSSPAKAVAEYVLELPTYNDPAYDSDKNPRVAAQSEMRYIDMLTFGI